MLAGVLSQPVAGSDKIVAMQYKIYPGEHGWHVEERDGKFYCVETGLPVVVIVPPAESPTSATSSGA